MNKARLLAAPLIALLKVHWITLCIVAGLLVLYTLAGFFLVPYIARQQVENYVAETLQRKVSIGDIRFNPFLFNASVSDFRLAEADDSPLVSFRHLYVNAQLASLWRRAVILRAVQLSAPNIELVIEKDASVNLARLFRESAEPEPQEETTSTRVHIGTLAVREGRIGIEDYTATKAFTAAITPIRFTLNDFRTDAGFANAYDFSGTTTSGEQLAWLGDFTVEPLGSNGRFSVKGLKLATVQSYLQESIPFRLASGDADLGGDYRFALDPEFSLDVTLPSVQVRDLSLTELQGQGEAAAPVVLPAVEVQQIVFSYEKRDVGLKLVDVKDARIAVAMEADGSISLMNLLNAVQPVADSAVSSASTPTPTLPRVAEQGAEKAGTSAPSSSPAPQAAGSKSGGDDWRIHIDTIHLANASLAAEDRSVAPATKFDLTPVQATINNWSTDTDATLAVDADVTINKQGRLLTKGELQLDPLRARLAVDLKEFDLPVIQPYLDLATDMTLHSGKLSVKGDVSYTAVPELAQPLAFKGEAQVVDLRTTDQLMNEDFIKWRNLAVTGIDYSQYPDRLNIERIVARQPYARVVIAKDTTLNVNQVLRVESEPDEAEEPAPEKRERGANRSKSRAKVAAAPPPPPPPATQPVFPMRIRTVQFIDGSANFADYSIQPSFATGILELNGTVTGLSSDPASRAQVKLDGKVDKYAPVDITGTVNILVSDDVHGPRDEFPQHGADDVQPVLRKICRL